MSLVESIFQGSKAKRALSDLFETKIELPEPQQVSIQQQPASKRKRSSDHQEDATPQPLASAEEPGSPSDDPLVDDRTVFVGNLPVEFTRKSLAKLFGKCGKIASTRIRSVATTGVKLPPQRAGDQALVQKVCANTHRVDPSIKSNVQGYVVFVDATSVSQALQMNNTEVMDVSANAMRRIRVDHAKPSMDAGRSVFVGNLPYAAQEDSLQHHVCHVCDLKPGDVEGVRIVRDKTTFQCKGFGYVLFREKSMVATALRRLNGTIYKNRELRATVCGRRFKGKKGEKTPEQSSSTSFPKRQKLEAIGALKRILDKDEQHSKKRRPRSDKKSNRSSVKKAGVSRKAAAEAKVGKRVKKIEKRIKKGMGKARGKK